MTPQPDQPQVLVVGAGPTGLNLALQLARRGVPFRVIDKAAGPGTMSRATIIHARNLEFYAQLGFADEVVAAGIKIEQIHLRKDARQFAEVGLADMGDGVSPYPYLLCFPQDDHERFLARKLDQAGVAVEWGVELAGFAEQGDGVRATLRRGGEAEEAEFAYVCGCDGAHSAVRHGLGIGFEGGTYDNLYYVADVKTDPQGTSEAYLNLAGDGFCLMMPVRSSGMQRLIGVVPRALAGKPKLEFEDFRGIAERFLGVKVTEVNWFSPYRVHHRVAERFRVGRCFLLGDAGHVHSPVGGQGMNTGIGDAVNLGWKLADVLAGRADGRLLDSYEPERLAFARKLVGTTDTAFQWVAGPGLVGRLFRSAVLPAVVPLLTAFRRARRLLFLTVSQTRLAYPDSPLSVGEAGSIAAGDRLPWFAAAGDERSPVPPPAWHVRVHGTAAPEFTRAAESHSLPVEAIPWGPAAKRAGFGRDAAYLLRPDGHVALALPRQDSKALARYLESHALTPSREDAGVPR